MCVILVIETRILSRTARPATLLLDALLVLMLFAHHAAAAKVLTAEYDSTLVFRFPGAPMKVALGRATRLRHHHIVLVLRHHLLLLHVGHVLPLMLILHLVLRVHHLLLITWVTVHVLLDYTT